MVGKASCTVHLLPELQSCSQESSHFSHRMPSEDDNSDDGVAEQDSKIHRRK